ncbi:two-component sensor histidine kinase [Paenibacillus sp. CAA11]|uniref:sensor histidine kinase n=1 Tax=Paenibacillus sp. CAA11 TaxID=1532905 RepID=UPI000D395DD7|nr:ATP-binding protein [Paenibacillus sp. CAA11]AWB44618.1 two-component sensor histidine kinase [Paenibacillus sp. CAA11]
MTQTQLDYLIPLLMKLFENSTEAIFFFDRNGKTIAMNPAAEEIVGEDVLIQLYQGKHRALCATCRGYTSDTEAITCLECYFQIPETENLSSFQVYLETKGKGVVPYTASFHTIDPDYGIRVFMLRDLTMQFQTQENLYQNKMMKHVIEAQENERKRISRELHDSVAQELMSAVVDLRVLKYMTQDEQLLKKMKQTEASMTRLLDDIRNLSVELRPPALDDLGLEAAFRSHFKRLERNYGFLIEFTSDLSQKRYRSEVETVIYRVCQEALLNALKYAQVDTVHVSLTDTGEMLYLRVEDEGVGFEPGDKPLGTGMGLYGMQERAELAGGSFSVQSRAGSGTKILLQIPVGNEKGED